MSQSEVNYASFHHPWFCILVRTHVQILTDTKLLFMLLSSNPLYFPKKTVKFKLQNKLKLLSDMLKIEDLDENVENVMNLSKFQNTCVCNF